MTIELIELSRFTSSLGTTISVANPDECSDFDHLKGHVVLIDGREYMVRRIECYAHLPPWRKSEIIGLLV